MKSITVLGGEFQYRGGLKVQLKPSVWEHFQTSNRGGRSKGSKEAFLLRNE